MRKQHHKKGVFIISFGFGLLVACFCPPKFLIVVLSITVIVLGIANCR